MTPSGQPRMALVRALGRSLWGFLAVNAHYKLLALAIALGIWLWLNLSVNPVESLRLRMPVSVLSDPEVQSSADPSRVAVDFFGQHQSLQELREHPGDLRAVVDGRGRSSGSFLGEVELEGLGQGIRYSSTPSHVNVDLRPWDRKSVPVWLLWMGKVPEGTSLPENEITTIPAEVEVSGPRESVDETQAVRALVDREALLRRQHMDVPLRPVGAGGQVVDDPALTVEPPEGRISLPTDIGLSKLVPIEPRMTGTPRSGYKVQGVSCNPFEVEVRGDAVELSHVTSIPTEPIDISHANRTLNVHASLRPPSGIIPRRFSAVDVTVNIVKE